ncbi:MAG: hypothetical protein K2Q21_13945 [Chitinophagaceae bacterium]|nr:hypothetical protein [Chitinophagaceae bacterium]
MRYFGLLIILICSFCNTKAQPHTPETDQFYYSAKGVSFVPAIKKPGLIYEGQLFNDKRGLDYLMAKLNKPECYLQYFEYRSNKTWATVLNILGTATSVVGLIGTNDNRNVNWFLLGGGILLNGSAVVLNSVAAQHLKAIALLMDQQYKHTGMISSPQNLSINIPIK